MQSYRATRPPDIHLCFLQHTGHKNHIYTTYNMPSTAIKRNAPTEVSEARPQKVQKTTSANTVVQQQAVRPNELWATICKTDMQTLSEIVYHATLASIDPQVSLRVLNMHHTRIHNEAVAAEQARKAQEAREKRDRKKITDFDQHFRQIDWWVSNDPINRKACRTSYSIYEKVAARITKIEEKATEATTNFASKCNALETLRKVVDTICRHSGGAMGIEIYTYLHDDRSIEDSMLSILKSMTADEREELLTVKHDGALWIELMEKLDTFRQTKKIYFGDHAGTPPFPGISDVLDFVYGDQRAEDDSLVKEKPLYGDQNVESDVVVKQEP